jgi:kynureninase
VAGKLEGMLSRDEAIALDSADPLAAWRDEFVIPDPDLVYLDGNSLGRTPRRTVHRLHDLMATEWADDLILSWDRWLHLPTRVGDRLATVIGAASGEVVVHDSTTINLYQLVHAAIGLRPGRRTLVVDDQDFPTDRYVVEGVAQALGLQVRSWGDGLDDDVAVAVRSVIDYRSAAMADIAADTAHATAHGALVIWDLSHAAGAVDIDLHAAGVELAVGCTYKFLNGGPGAPAFTYVAQQLQSDIQQPIWGWFAQTDLFEMGPTFTPQTDMRRFLMGTPGILGLVAADEGIGLTADAGIGNIADKGRRLIDVLVTLCDDLGLAVITPRDPARRGLHVAVEHPDARRLVPLLAREHKVVTDFRAPNVIRLGCSPLTTRFVDVWTAATTIAEVAGQRRG